jgi:tetratricopeptide (TPR) repeat protein
LARGCALLLTLLLAWAAAGCSFPTPQAKLSHLERVRRAAAASSDGDRLGRWLLAELVAPKGDPKRAAKARARLTKLRGRGVYGHLALAIDDDVHGRFAPAARSYLAALEAVRESARGDRELLGWFVTNRLNALRGAVPSLWKEAEALVTTSIAQPRGIGWRARGELVEWAAAQQLMARGEVDAAKLFERVAEQHGCLVEARFAGPFGRNAPSDHRVHYAPERPAPWPARFPPNPRRLRRPEQFEARRHGCLLRPRDAAGRGVYYVQSFVELTSPQDVVLAVQGAHAVFVDDHEVLTRDAASWGVWPRFGARLYLQAGRHRIVARLLTPETSIRLLTPEGVALGVRGSADDRLAYQQTPPRPGRDPNVLAPYLDDLGVPRIAGVRRSRPRLDLDDAGLRYLGSYLAHVERQDDLASVLLEPLVKELDDATPVALAQQAVFVDGDPIFARGAARDLARDLRARAAEGDADLWGPHVWLALEKAGKDDASEAVRELEELAKRFEQVPVVGKQLANVYARLGWRAERAATLERAAKRFPEDVDVLKALLGVYERRGEHKRADALADRIRAIDPTDEVDLRRALERRDYPAAVAELRRIGRLRKDRRDIAIRVADLLARSGTRRESLKKLELALEREPNDAAARLALADARYAAGDRTALSDALVEALRSGAGTRELRAAVELVEGMTDLEPYRRDGLAVVKANEASGAKMPGSAARVLDYAALWVAEDGSARMLEHEIIRVQSREGIKQHVEQKLPRGVVLRMRTIKKDGRVFEPEQVAGKPTVTMPHLEVGDYVETESIWMLRGDGEGGRAFVAPRWFFREKDVSYHLSELVVISPKHRPLVVETTGTVPKPKLRDDGALVERRWVVEGSVALPQEPLSAPVQEFLPSVRVGWGVTLEERLRRLADAHADESPHDPRLRRIAKTIARGKIDDSSKAPKVSADARARKIYRWVMDNVQPGDERSPPRVITGKSGDRMAAFVYLCRLAGIAADIAVVRDGLSPPPQGPFSEAATFTAPVVRVGSGKQRRWLLVGDRFAPYGYLPSSLRGQPAAIVGVRTPKRTPDPANLERDRTASGGDEDGLLHDARVALRADGSATLDLTQRYSGKYAIIGRTALNKVLPARRKDVVEARVLGLALPGARVKELEVEQLEDLDEPLVLRMKVEAPFLAKASGGELRLTVPFLPKLGNLTVLEQRQTPIYLSERVASHSHVKLRIELPEGASVVDAKTSEHLQEKLRYVKVDDQLNGKLLQVERELSLPAGRVAPTDYPAFRKWLTRADGVLNRTVVIRLR